MSTESITDGPDSAIAIDDGEELDVVEVLVKQSFYAFKIPEGVWTLGLPKPRQEGFSPTMPIPLRDLDAATLSALCDKFRNGVFKAAGKTDPRTTYSK